MLVLFDIDDTLVDHTSAVSAGVTWLHAAVRPQAPLPLFLAAWHDAMRQHFPRYLNGEITYQDQRRARVRQTIHSELTDGEIDELFDGYTSAYEAHWSLFPDVLSCHDGHAEHRHGIISNGKGVEQRSKLERTGIMERFEAIHISSECGHAKPAAEIFHRACRVAGVAVEDAVYVGDLYETDALGARRAGLLGVWLDRKQSRRADHAPPVICGLAELREVLLVRVGGAPARVQG
jgi:putative hydrolase of the HAD superfamily